jgi:uncharacterized iron-regulated membrane protein
MPSPIPKSRARRMRAQRVGWAVHRVLGLGLGGLILLMSLTGGTLVMHEEIERALFPERHIVAVPPAAERAPVPLASILTRLAVEAPAGYQLLRVEPAHAPDETHKILFVAPDQRTRWAAFVNPYTGAVLWRGMDQVLFTPWILQLHMQLRAGGWGYLVTGCAGAALLLLGVTGLIIYRGRLAAFWRRSIRLDRGWRTGVADLHPWLGVLSIYFSLVLGLTGAIYAWKTAPNYLGAPKPAPAARFNLAQLAPIEPMLARARERFPAAELFRLAFPNTAKAPLTVTLLHRDAPVWRKFSRVELDPVTGAVRAVRDARLAAPGEKFAAMLAPLHFGLYGSPLTKWLYVLGGFSPALLAASGIAIWMLRRHRRGSAETRAALREPAVLTDAV